jgi:hypothetical protein
LRLDDRNFGIPRRATASRPAPKFVANTRRKLRLPDRFAIGTRRKPGVVILSHFNQKDSEGRTISALIVAIDSSKYKQTLKELGVKREDIIDEFASGTKAKL